MTVNKHSFIFEITSSCNLDCTYCYNVWWEEKNYKRGSLTFSHFKTIIDKLTQDTNIENIAFAGGEPLLNPELSKMVNYTIENNIRSIIASNGLLLSDKKISSLQQVNDFIISLPSLNHTFFEQLSGKQSSHLNRIRKNIVTLKKRKKNIAIAVTLVKNSLQYIDDIVSFCHALGVNEIQFNRFCPGGKGLRNTDKLKLSSKELKQILEKLNKLASNKSTSFTMSITIEPCLFPVQKYPNLTFGMCQCGVRKWTIDYSGNLRVCEQDLRILGNLQNQSFTDLITDQYAHQFNNDNLKSKCNSCSSYSACRGGCRYAR